MEYLDCTLTTVSAEDEELVGSRHGGGALQKKFPFRKVKYDEAEFAGAQLKQEESGAIVISQEKFVDDMKILKVPTGIGDDVPATPMMVSQARGLLGAANWLHAQTRADLSVLVSFGQQRMSALTYGDCRRLNQIVRRAEQFRSASVRIPHVLRERLCFSALSDASFQNGPGGSTQAGALVIVSDVSLGENKRVEWGPVCWRSHKLKRIVGSTLAAETMSALEAQGSLEWIKCLWSDMCDESFELDKREEYIARTPSYHLVDAKSLWDHVRSSSPSSGVEDRRAGIDLVLLKQCVSRTGSVLRWGPTSNMLADVLTKDAAGPADTWRGYAGRLFGLTSEEEALATRAEAKRARQERGVKRQQEAERKSSVKEAEVEAGE